MKKILIIFMLCILHNQSFAMNIQELRKRAQSLPVQDEETLKCNYMQRIKTPLSKEQKKGLSPEEIRKIKNNQYKEMRRDADHCLTGYAYCCLCCLGCGFIFYDQIINYMTN